MSAPNIIRALNTNLVVPPKKQWIVRGAALQVTGKPTGDAFVWALLLDPAGNPFGSLVARVYHNAAASPYAETDRLTYPEPVILPTGYIIQVNTAGWPNDATGDAVITLDVAEVSAS